MCALRPRGCRASPGFHNEFISSCRFRGDLFDGFMKGSNSGLTTWKDRIMRPLVSFVHMTVDGYVSSGQGMGIEWTHRGYSEQLAAYVQEHIQADFDAAVYGRETYLGMYGYWGSQPNPESSASERVHAEWVNAVDKIVCSTTLESADWNNTRLIKDNLADEFAKLKDQPGGTMAIYASPKLVHSLMGMGLIDEFRIIVHPVVIGGGTPLFQDKSALEIALVESETFDSGAVYLRYRLG